jgi:hypothetical protein
MTSRITAIPVFRDNSGLRKYPRQWAPHDLTETHKVERVPFSRSLLESLGLHENTEFKGLATGDEPQVC